jgi:hypothetical protein
MLGLAACSWWQMFSPLEESERQMLGLGLFSLC